MVPIGAKSCDQRTLAHTHTQLVFGIAILVSGNILHSLNYLKLKLISLLSGEFGLQFILIKPNWVRLLRIHHKVQYYLSGLH